MVNVRRAYVFLVCLFSLQPVAWALIALLRALIAEGDRMQMLVIAFEIAVILIGLPIFLLHWLWAQHSARGVDERASVLRRGYLYTTLAVLLAPFIANAYDLFAWLLKSLIGRTSRGLAPTDAILSDLATLGVLGVLWTYHYLVVREDARLAPETDFAGALKRLYILVFSATGLTMTALAGIELLRWTLFQFGDASARAARLIVGDQIALLIVGLPVWTIFWMQAQRLFAGKDDEERESVLRKAYLYLVVFVTVLTFVTGVAVLIAGGLRAALGLKNTDDAREILPTIIVAAIVWAYHAFILRGDARAAGEEPRQAGIRRLYHYLVAGIGLAAFLVGLGGDISVVITVLFGGGFAGNPLKEELAWFSAALGAGLLVWILPWRRAQNAAIASPPAGADERRSVVRKIYLFFYLFVATMTVLAAAVYIVFRPLSIVLGVPLDGNLIAELAHALAYALIGLLVWIYHGWALRGDGELNRRARVARLADLRVAVVNVEPGSFGEALVKELQREFPGLAIDLIDLSASRQDAVARLGQAGVIVGAWTMAVAREATEEIANAIAASSARKLLIPTRSENWEWVGVEAARAFAPQAARALKQIVEGEEVRGKPPTIALVIGGIGLICILIQVVPALIGLLIAFAE